MVYSVMLPLSYVRSVSEKPLYIFKHFGSKRIICLRCIALR